MASIRHFPWDSDRVKSKSSLDVLLEWITTGDNYARWQDRSLQKKTLCEEIQTLLLEQGIKHRSEQDIHKKIQALEKSVKAAKRLIMHSGNDGSITSIEHFHNDSLEQKILKECPIFNTLAPVMVPHIQIETRSLAKRQRRDAGGAASVLTTQSTEYEQEVENGTGPDGILESSGATEKDALYAESDSDTTLVDETNALQRQDIREQFELKRAKRKLEYQESKVKVEMVLVVEREMCRQRLVNAGISSDDVESVLPRKRLPSGTDEF